MIALLVMTDGRAGYLAQTLGSFEEAVSGPISRRIIHDDSGDPAYRQHLLERYADYEIYSTPGRSGFAGAIQSAWRVLGSSDEPYIFHLEDDFIFTKPVNLSDLIELIEDYPYLAQVAFRRQAWNSIEKEHGGFIEAAPGWYTERSDGKREWVETRRNWTTNPSLYPREVLSLGWPDAPASEGMFGFRLKAEGLQKRGIKPEEVQFGFWGSLEGGREWVWHIGEHRVGTNY